MYQTMCLETKNICVLQYQHFVAWGKQKNTYNVSKNHRKLMIS